MKIKGNKGQILLISGIHLASGLLIMKNNKFPYCFNPI